ncbi:MAG: type III PLP-dependent enzyme [Rubellimicrobium sp.]|nr:type III PLP-dependent enzyme [Rubellimicrobium sp.]
MHQPITATDPRAWLAANRPALPVLFFAPDALRSRLDEFHRGFAGLVTFAVKANPSPEVLATLIDGGIRGFDVASPAEMRLVRGLSGEVAMHYNNPVRSPDEIAESITHGVTSWSVDDAGELAKLIAAPLPAGTEIAVRLRLPVAGAAYDFGSKFGATPDEAVALLRQVARAGLTPAMTFHVGTQCTDPAAWGEYVTACAAIAREAGVTLARLNVGGGFPSARGGDAPALAPFFAAITGAMAAFDTPPALVCEPGRALVADAFAYAVRVKSLRSGRAYLEDGIYGGLSEFPTMGTPRFVAVAPDGTLRGAAVEPRVVFGPTCDSLDRLPGEIALPEGLAEGDHLLFPSTGAYLAGVSTSFNGYGDWQQVTVARL